MGGSNDRAIIYLKKTVVPGKNNCIIIELNLPVLESSSLRSVNTLKTVLGQNCCCPPARENKQ
jgi:hypothetical protein